MQQKTTHQIISSKSNKNFSEVIICDTAGSSPFDLECSKIIFLKLKIHDQKNTSTFMP